MKILYYGYRDWSLDIFNRINIESKYLVTHKDYNIVEHINPDIIFFIGWSHIVPDEIINNYKCVCLHPSPLPKYRGGTPIQHQIINGELQSAVTMFIMDSGVDTGDIVYQSNFSLDGTLLDIFDRISNKGSDGINFILDNLDKIDTLRIKQDNTQSTSFRRRKIEDSEITIDDINNCDPIVLHNKIRSLNDPYPNAYIRCKNGEKLFLIHTRINEK